MKKYADFVIAALLTSILCVAISAKAQNTVKYCINLETGETIAVPDGRPCPFPFADY